MPASALDVGLGECAAATRLRSRATWVARGVFDQATADFSAAYTDKNVGDFALLEEAVSAGRSSIERGL